MNTKYCWGCKHKKDVSEFYKNKNEKDGLTGLCKCCEKERVKARYIAGREIVVKKKRDYYHINRDEIRKRQRARSKERGNVWYENNKEKHRARARVRYAVGTGKLERPINCSKCQLFGDIQGHHIDYSKPLEVIWLCRKCHEYEHHGIR